MTGSAKPSIASAVIASEAKQSIAPRKERMDCFVAALLAMTGRVRGGTPHPPPSSPANRPRESAPDDRLREASIAPAVIASAAKQSIAPAVIASEAKQSILPRKERMDCFAEPVIGRA